MLRGVDTVVLDCETSSLYPWRDGRILAGIGVKPLGGDSFYISFRHGENGKDENNVPLWVLEELRTALTGKTIVFHNQKFDLAVLWQDQQPEFVDFDVLDTVVLMRLVHENEPTYRLKKLAEKYIDEDAALYERDLKKYIKKHQLKNYAEVPAEAILPYVEKDLEYTEWFLEHALPIIEQRKLQELLELEQTTARTLFHVERRGFKIDLQYIAERQGVLVPEAEVTAKRCYALVESLLTRRWKKQKRQPDDALAKAIALFKEEGKTFGVQNATHARVLFHGLGVTSHIRTPKGGESWDKNALELVSKEHDDPEARELASQIVTTRSLLKVLSYYNTFMELVDKDGILHPSINQAGARTGRMSMCVPLDSEILTRDGWKRWNELQVGQDVVGLNMMTGVLEHTPLLRVFRGRDHVGDLQFREESTGKKRRGIRCTREHRWIGSSRFIERGFVRAKSCMGRLWGQNNKIITAGLPGAEGESTLTPVEAAVLGWAFTDGCLQRLDSGRRRLGIGVHKPTSNAALNELDKSVHFKRATYYKKDGYEVYSFGLGVQRTEDLLAKARYDELGLTGVVMSLTTPARLAMFDAMMEADGSPRKKAKGFGAAKQEVWDAFMALCALLGKATTYRLYRPAPDKQLFMGIGVLSRPYVTCPKFLEGTGAEEEVWCPITGLGTWVVRQNGVVSVTGNTEPNLQQVPKVESLAGLRSVLAVTEKRAHHDTADDDEISAEDAKTGEVRDAFIARPGFFLLMADWAQIEPRILADLANEHEWIRAFEMGLDIYEVAAYAAYGPPPNDKKLHQWWRKLGKLIVLSIVYGVGKAKLASSIGKEPDQAQEFKNAFFNRYPRLRLLLNQVSEKCDARRVVSGGGLGWVRNLWGRRRYLEEGENYKAPNFLIQGSAADFTKDVSNRLHVMLESTIADTINNVLTRYTSGIVDVIHDEYIFEIAYDEAAEVIPRIVNEMTTCDRLKVPLKVDLKWSPTRWGDARDLACATCAGSGLAYEQSAKEMFTLLVKGKHEQLDAIEGTTCVECAGKGYNIPVEEVSQHAA